MASQSTILFADFDSAGAFTSSTLAASIVQAARDSLTAGQFNVGLNPLSIGDVKSATQEYLSGHDRLSPDNNLLLLDAAAMLAYSPYRATILLSDDPFESVERIQEAVGLDADFMRMRVHDALLHASKIISLSQAAHEAVVPILPIAPERRPIPSRALREGGAAILLVDNIDDDSSGEVRDSLHDAFPEREFAAFDPSIAFERPWKLVLHLGVAHSSFPGARLTDAWAGSVPLLQLVDTNSLAMHRRRRPKQFGDVVVEHGKTGLLCSTENELKAVLSELCTDILPARAVARGAKWRADPSGEWDDLLKAVLQ